MQKESARMENYESIKYSRSMPESPEAEIIAPKCPVLCETLKNISDEAIIKSLSKIASPTIMGTERNLEFECKPIGLDSPGMVEILDRMNYGEFDATFKTMDEEAYKRMIEKAWEGKECSGETQTER